MYMCVCVYIQRTEVFLHAHMYMFVDVVLVKIIYTLVLLYINLVPLRKLVGGLHYPNTTRESQSYLTLMDSAST